MCVRLSDGAIFGEGVLINCIFKFCCETRARLVTRE